MVSCSPAAKYIVLLLHFMILLCALLPQAIKISGLPLQRDNSAQAFNMTPGLARPALTGMASDGNYSRARRVLLTDITSSTLHGPISVAFGHTYLSPPLGYIRWPAWPLGGIIYGGPDSKFPIYRFLVMVAASDASEANSKKIILYFVVDTGSPYTFISEEAAKALGGYSYRPGTLPVFLQGVRFKVQISPPRDERIKDVCVMGADFLKAIGAELSITNQQQKQYQVFFISKVM